MEQPCYKCGASIEEGVAFCPQCNAPQIRVIAPEPALIQNSPSDLGPLTSYAPPARELRFPEAWWAAGQGVLVGAIPVVLLLGPAIGMMAAGFLAVFFYRRLAPRRFTVALGARLGALCGLLASGALVLGVAAAATIFHQGARMQKGLLDILQQSWARMSISPPQEAVEMFKTPAGMVLFAFIFLLLTMLFSTLGGMLGAALLGRKDKA